MIKTKKSKVLAASLAVLMVAGVFFGASTLGAQGATEAEEDETSRQILVDTSTPYIGNITVTGEFIGNVEPDQQVAVISKASGEVLETFLNVGEVVEAGDVLAEIDSTTLRNGIAQTQAALNSASALAGLGVRSAERNQSIYYGDIDIGYNTSLVEAQAKLDAAELKLQQANDALRTARKNYIEARDEGADDMTLNNLRTARVQYELGVEAAQLELENTKLALDITKKAVEEGKASIDDGVEKARIDADLTQQYLQLEQQQNTLKDYTITAPISGIIEQRNIDQYDMVSAGTPVFVISNKNAMMVSFKVSEVAYAHMQVGDFITVEKNGNVSTGVITEISTMVDASGLFTVKANVTNPPKDLYTGSAVKIYADTQKAQNAMVIPLDSLYYDNGLPYVYIVENNLVRKIQVEVGIYDSDQIEILSGLSMNDQIITTWNPNLADGAEVLVAGSSSSGASGSETQAEEAAEEEDGNAAGVDDADVSASEEAAEEAVEESDDSQEEAGDDQSETLPDEEGEAE